MSRKNKGSRKRGRHGGRRFSKEYQPENRGRKKIPDEVRALRELTQETFSSVVSTYLLMPTRNVQLAKENSELTAVERLVVAIILEGIDKADPARLECLLQRAIGKVKEEIDINKYQRLVDKMGMDELLVTSQAALDFFKEKRGDLQ